MNIIIEFDDPGNYTYTVEAVHNYKSNPGISYVVGAYFKRGFVLNPSSNTSEMLLSNHVGDRVCSLDRLDKFLDRYEMELYIRKEIRQSEFYKDMVIKNSERLYENLSDGISILEKAFESKKYSQEELSDAISILERAEINRKVNEAIWMENPLKPKESIPVKGNGNAISKTLFRVSKKKQVTKDRKVIPMKSNLKFKR